MFPCKAAATGAVTLGFRPEHIRLTGPDEAHFSGRLLTTENTGDRLNLVLLVAGQEIRVSLNERHDLRIGETVHGKVLDDHFHLFDRGTGVRVP
jgi:ABC-type sugar transport system ATPase subunit